jgi:preprotein translocase subunit Sec61beta
MYLSEGLKRCNLLRCGVGSLSSRRRRREAPLSPAAGLVRFFEEVEAVFEVTPKQIILVSVLFIASILLLNLLGR